MSTEVGLSATMRLIERYGMTEPPFSLSPDPRYLYMTPQHTRALAHLRFTIDDRAGLAVLYGDVGHGKSTIVRRLFDAVGFPVLRLVRVKVGPIGLGDQRQGSIRNLGKQEVGHLLASVGL